MVILVNTGILQRGGVASGRVCVCSLHSKLDFIFIGWFLQTKKNQFWKANILKSTVKNTRGSVEKLSLKESVKGGDAALRDSVRAPKGFSKGKPKAAKPRGRSPQGFAAKGLFEENPEGALKLPRSAVWAPKALS